LQRKTQGLICHAPASPKYSASATTSQPPNSSSCNIHSTTPTIATTTDNNINGPIEQEEYEEDHADEERMFSEMDARLSELRTGLLQRASSVPSLARAIQERARALATHLMAHLDKEELQCMPLVVTHLSREEIHELVGNIMGKRSADTIAQIMTMAVQNLEESEREEMVKYMKQSMAGTFFDKWLLMSGWMESTTTTTNASEDDRKRAAEMDNDDHDKHEKKVKTEGGDDTHRSIKQTVVVPLLDERHRSNAESFHQSPSIESNAQRAPMESTSQEELEKLIRVVAANPTLTPAQKNTTIQGLRDSVWKNNQRARERLEAEPILVNSCIPVGPSFPSSHRSIGTDAARGASGGACSRTRRVTPPSIYYKRTKEGMAVVWNSDDPTSRLPEDGSVPLFSPAELAPTYHDGAAGAVLGCPHYSRACKLRHPKSGRLYTCRLCCEQQRELPMKDQDEPLDRYEVQEIMCMRCNALQPAGDRCINADCETRGKPFARYFCKICNLFDDSSRPIFHCPYCNICRLGLGLGIDFRHCMRCNACVSLADDDHHCIPQKLQGDCPICHESLFESTEPLRGLKCGHVMHLPCFTEQRRHSYTCPLCMRSMDDMKDYFSILDSAVRMQPMPAAYLSTLSNIYCQDCGSTGQCQYHFVGQKCPSCCSYNTRELGRVQIGDTNSHG
jgi:hypothetical protein